MDYTTSKAFTIGVGIFATLIIVGAFILVLTTVSDIYNATENTNTSIAAQFDNVYSMYAGAVLNALNLKNTLRKYENDNIVKVYVKFKKLSGTISGKEEIETKLKNYNIGDEELFDVFVDQDNNNIKIIFTER